MPPLLHTHALATLPAFGNLGKPRRPLFGNVANFWQPCHCLEHFRRPILAAPVTPPLRRDRNQPVPHAQPAIGRPPTASCANTSLLPTADCPLPTAHCLLPPTAAVCTRSSQANGGASAPPHWSSAGRYWQRAYRGRRCCVCSAEPLAGVGGACLGRRKWGQLGLFLNRQFNMSPFRICPRQENLPCFGVGFLGILALSSCGRIARMPWPVSDSPTNENCGRAPTCLPT